MKYNFIKKSLAPAAILLCVLNTNAQILKVEKDSTSKVKNVNLSLGKSDNDTTQYPRIYGGLTFSRIDWGFSRIMQDGSFNLSEDNKFLSGGKASNFGFDIAQFGLRFNDNFKTYLSTGFEWNYNRLQQNVLLGRKTTPLLVEKIDENEVYYNKNVLTSTYLRIPLSLEWRSNKNRHGDRVKVAGGLMTGVLLKGSQRLKSKENGKQGFRDNYNLASFQYGPFIRIGYDDFGIFAKYYVNDSFENSPNQEGINNLTFGITLGF